MTIPLGIALTADLHWGHNPRGVEATRQLVSFLESHPPDLLVLGGDIGTGTLFNDCLAQFNRLSCRKALVPGNHDLWVKAEAEYDSLTLYREQLPRIAAQNGFHYLDAGPLILPGSGVALVGTINWYDHSWAIDRLKQYHPEELHRLQTKRFSRGRHNDANFVRWPLDEASFTREVVTTFETHLNEALGQVEKAIVVTHHPPFYGLGFSRPCPPTTLDCLLWDAFCGNQAMEEVLERHADRVAFAFCGHTHRARENTLKGIRGYNIGGDYRFKRLLLLDWPAGTVTAHQFGEPD
jgi:predicted phosphohydrolase